MATNSRTYTWSSPAARPAELSGLDFLQAMLDGKIPAAPISSTMGWNLVEVQSGVAVFHGETSEYLYNPVGSVHGGFFAGLLDSALGCAVLSSLPAGQSFTTTQLGVHMVRPAFADTGPLRCMGKVVHLGRRVATAEARVIGVRDGKLYAHGSASCAIISTSP